MKTIKFFDFLIFWFFFIFWTNFDKIIRKFAFITNSFDLTFVMFFFSRLTKSIFESMTNVSFFRFFRFLLRFFRRRSRLFFRRFFSRSFRSFSRFLFRENLLKRLFTSSWKFRFRFLFSRKLSIINFNFWFKLNSNFIIFRCNFELITLFLLNFFL